MPVPPPAPADLDARFRAALRVLDAGDLEALAEEVRACPALLTGRLETPGPWLREAVGRAADGFFARPYLLWFIAEDPERNRRLPPNAPAVIAALTTWARDAGAPTLQEQVDGALRLVCWSGVAAREGLQLAMIDALLAAGAVPARNAHNALVNGHRAAADHLLRRGGELTLAAALCTGRMAEVPALAAAATPGKRQFSLVLAALNGCAEAVAWMVRDGVPVNEPCPDLYSHGTPLHHAVASGSLATVQALVEGGADLQRADTAWHGTPLGWALHYMESAPEASREGYQAIARYLDQRQGAE